MYACGDGIERIIEMIYTKNGKKLEIPLIEMKHPSYWAIGDAKYKESFKEKILKLKF